MRGSACTAIAVLALYGSSASGRELWRRGDASVHLSGSVRQLVLSTRATDAARFDRAMADTFPADDCVAAARFPDCAAFRLVGRRDVWQSLTRARTRLDVGFTHGFSGAVVYDHELLTGVLGTLEGGMAERLGADPFLSLQQDIVDFDFGAAAEQGTWRHLVYRAYLNYEAEHVEIVLGRQRIPWGVGRLWNPMDRLNFIPPLAVEADQSPGVDAIDAKWMLSGFSYVEAALAPAARWSDSSYALRAHGVLRDIDYSLVAGVFREARTAGADFAGNLGAAAVRLQATYADPERDVWPIGAARPRELRSFWQVEASADRNIDIGAGVYVLVEYLYNGNALGFGRGRGGALLPFFESADNPPPGVPPEVSEVVNGPFVKSASADRLGGSQVVTGGRHQSGLQLGYDVLPMIRGDLLVLYDWDGRSAALAPSLKYEPLEFLEITAGAQFFAGPRRSEYGSAETLAFLLSEMFF